MRFDVGIFKVAGVVFAQRLDECFKIGVSGQDSAGGAIGQIPPGLFIPLNIESFVVVALRFPPEEVVAAGGRMAGQREGDPGHRLELVDVNAVILVVPGNRLLLVLGGLGIGGVLFPGVLRNGEV